MSAELCRIYKYETLDQTYYIPQYKTSGFFGGEKWVSFVIANVKKQYGDGRCNQLFKLSSMDSFYFEREIISFSKVLNKENAESSIKEWLRVNHGNKVIKTWSAEEDN